MQSLQGKVAVVTGASRGVGQGIVLGLGEAGATVYITGRTVEADTGIEGLAGTVGNTAKQVTELGGQGIPVQCDHQNDAEVKALFQQVFDEQGKINILVNNVWGGYEFMVDEEWNYTWENLFWEQPLSRWRGMFRAGLRAHFTASQYAAKQMVQQRNGLIVNIVEYCCWLNISSDERL